MEELDLVEKEAKTKEYSPDYINELLEAVRQYVPPHVMENLHRKALPRAGGKASARARAAQAQSQSADAQAATEAHQAQATQADVNADVSKQPLPSGVDDEDDEEEDGAEQTPQKSKGKMTKEDIQKALTSSDKAKLTAEINSKSTADLTAYHRRLHQQAAQGNVLTGFSQADMTSFHNQIEQKLKEKADAKGGKSSAGSPLTFGKAAEAESDDDEEEDIDKCHFGTVDAIRERESKKSAEKSIEKQDDKEEEEIHPDCLKVARQCMQMKKEKSKKSVTKSAEVPTFIGRRPIVTFVAASPGTVEYIRKSALVGATGKTFNDEYLAPLGLTRNDIAITYLVPQLLKDDGGKVREPTGDEIESWQPWFRDEVAKIESGSKSKKHPIIALGHTVKKALGRDVEFTMPHPNSLYTPRTQDELQRKRLQVAKALEARYRKN